MTAVLEHREHAEAASYPAAVAPIAAIKVTLADLWPPAMIVLGLLLTAVWSGALLWLLFRAILALV